MAKKKPKAVHYVVVGRRSAVMAQALRTLLKGYPEFKVIVDRRMGERRRISDTTKSERRSPKDRRM